MRNKLIYAILSLLGLATACSKHHDEGGEVCMYGTPTVTFSVKGHVTDEKGQPIEGIRVSVQLYKATFTDAQGQFAFKKQQMIGMSSDRFIEELEFRDVDGEANGSFENRTVPVAFVRNKEVATSMWYLGDYEASDTDVVLRAKSNSEETE